jgi:penicillin-binding protein 2
MHLVVTSPNGTAYFGYGYDQLPYTAAGKTGTAEHAKGKSDHGSFVCFSPYEDPEIAIAVYIENGGHGSTLASIARSVLMEYFKVGTISDVSTNENRLS